MELELSNQPSRDVVRSSRILPLVVSAAFVLTGVVTTFLGPILPSLAARWRLSDSRSAYFFVTQYVGSIVGVGISSFLLPRRGHRFTIGFGYLLMALGVCGLGLTQWKFALSGTFTFGVALGLVIPASNVLISTLNPGRRAAALSILNFCWGLGAIAASAGVALAEHWGRIHDFAPALSGLLLIATVAVAFTPGTPHSEENTAPAIERRFVDWRMAAHVGAMFFLYVGVESSIGGWIATLAERASFGAGQAWILAPALFWSGLLAGRAAVPLLLRRLSEGRLTIFGLVIACAGICVLVLSHHRQWITISGAIVGAGLAAVFPITVTFLSRFRGMEKRIAGPMFGLSGLGGAVMPWLVGFLSTWFGSLHAGFVALLLVTVLLLWLHVSWSYES